MADKPATALSVDVSDKLLSAGEVLPFAGHLDLDGYTVGERPYRLEDGIDFDLMLTNAGEGILVTGIVRGTGVGECDRCLDPATFEIASEVDEYYLFEEPEDAGDDEEGFELVGEDKVIDLSGAVFDAIVMETPFVLLCRDDCRGLCPTCGCNLNREECDCAEREEQARADDEGNPFAVLKGLKLDE